MADRRKLTALSTRRWMTDHQGLPGLDTALARATTNGFSRDCSFQIEVDQGKELSEFCPKTPAEGHQFLPKVSEVPAASGSTR